MTKFKAFISCSLRPEDSQFVDFIENYLESNNVTPFGTVGRYDASAQNPVDLMKSNILESDFIVLCATKRYIQTDAHNHQRKDGISEMLQFEAGMAHANEKPIIVFVENGVNIGNAIPNITQYVTVSKQHDNFLMDYSLADKLINYAKKVSTQNADWQIIKGIGAVAISGFAAFGLYKALSSNK